MRGLWYSRLVMNTDGPMNKLLILGMPVFINDIYLSDIDVTAIPICFDVLVDSAPDTHTAQPGWPGF